MKGVEGADFNGGCMLACCRQDEGSVGQGYTVQELCQLARSSMPAQRTAACSFLAKLLARARPSAIGSYQSLFGGQKTPNLLFVPSSPEVHYQNHCLPARGLKNTTLVLETPFFTNTVSYDM